MDTLERLINGLGQLIERALTGQTDYRFTTSEFAEAGIICNQVQAKMTLPGVRELLSLRFGIIVKQPVIINLDKPRANNWKAILTADYNHVGLCDTRELGDEQAHSITIVPGLDRRKFQAVLAHEMVHAFQHEQAILRKHRGFREGMARWVEYHTLTSLGLEHEAQRLLGYRLYLLGRSLNTIMEYSNRHGEKATMEWLCNMDAAAEPAKPNSSQAE